MRNTLEPCRNPDSKVHGANMGPIWGRQDPGGPHVGPMNFVIWEGFHVHNVIMWCISFQDPWTVVETFKEVDAYVVVYSIADTESFNDAVDALHELRKDSSRDGAVILVANKGDIVRNREVTEDCKYLNEYLFLTNSHGDIQLSQENIMTNVSVNWLIIGSGNYRMYSSSLWTALMVVYC